MQMETFMTKTDDFVNEQQQETAQLICKDLTLDEDRHMYWQFIRMLQ